MGRGLSQLNGSNSSTSAPPPLGDGLSETAADRISIRGYDLAELIGTVPFSSVVHLLYTGDLPDPSTARLIDAVMVASIDHGAGTPSVLAARTAISGGATLQAGAAAGLLALGEFHGAAVESSMLAIGSVVDVAAGDGRPRRCRRSAGGHQPVAGPPGAGFGHRQHRQARPEARPTLRRRARGGDGRSPPRRRRGHRGGLARSVGRPVPINIDGAMAAVLGEVGFPSDLGNAVFIASRLTGILAHANEEQRTMPPMRRVDPVDHAYRGPGHRELSPWSGPRPPPTAPHRRGRRMTSPTAAEQLVEYLERRGVRHVFRLCGHTNIACWPPWPAATSSSSTCVTSRSPRTPPTATPG